MPLLSTLPMTLLQIRFSVTSLRFNNNNNNNNNNNKPSSY